MFFLDLRWSALTQAREANKAVDAAKKAFDEAAAAVKGKAKAKEGELSKASLGNGMDSMVGHGKATTAVLHGQKQ